MLADGLARVPDLEAVEQLAPRRRLASRGYRARRRRTSVRPRNSARKIVEERTFEDTGGGRRSDCGVVQTQRQMPVFTQKAPEYDVLIVADENQRVRRLLPLSDLGRASRRGLRRPRGRRAGIPPSSFGARQQLQNRFERMFHRYMTARDNQAWVAMRMIGDAVYRTKSADPKAALKSDAVARFRRRRLQGRETDASRPGTSSCASRSC